ncbi:MAG: TPM domain-containing protein [Bacteroidales bacterium]|nr:TPM domain-containing protein [Bacteroidales bacterium]
MRPSWLLICALLLWALSWLTASAAVAPPKGCFVADRVGALHPDTLRALDDSLRTYHSATGNRIVVAIMDSSMVCGGVEESARQLVKQWGLSRDRAALLLVLKPRTTGRPRAYVAPSEVLKPRFARMFCRHLGSDKVAGPIYDGHTYYHGITNGLPYIKCVMEGRFTAEDYRVERAGRWWPWYIAAGVALLLVAAFFPRRRNTP